VLQERFKGGRIDPRCPGVDRFRLLGSAVAGRVAHEQRQLGERCGLDVRVELDRVALPADLLLDHVDPLTVRFPDAPPCPLADPLRAFNRHVACSRCRAL
jgi:hypothetical protein